MGKEGVRRRERRDANFAIKNKTLDKQMLSPEEAEVLFRAIDNKDLRPFGIRSLCSIDLDGLHKAPSSVTWESSITLLSYAAWRQRDHHVSALLRAGADPSVRYVPDNLIEAFSDPLEKVKLDAKTKLARRPPQYAVWVLRALARMRQAGNSAKTAGTISEHCESCNKVLWQPVIWDPCGHACCEPCVWRCFGSAECDGECQLTCPCCGIEPSHEVQGCSGQSTSTKNKTLKVERCDWTCESCGYINFSRRVNCRNCGRLPVAGQDSAVHAETAEVGMIQQPISMKDGSSEVSPFFGRQVGLQHLVVAMSVMFAYGVVQPLRRGLALGVSASLTLAGMMVVLGWESKYKGLSGPTPAERKAMSFQKWKALPAAPADSEAARKPEKFKAMSVTAAAAAGVGTNQEHRTSDLAKAAVSGDVKRLSVLLDAGVDVDAVNGYGQTALFLAAWHGHAKTISLLLSWGADSNKPANGGCTPYVAAAMSGHAAAVDALMAGNTSVKKEQCDSSSVIVPKAVPQGRFVQLVDPGRAHPGAGSCYVEGCFTEEFLQRLEKLWPSLPFAEQRETAASSDRSYFCDVEGWVIKGLAEGMQQVGAASLPCKEALPQMRFLHYGQVGGYLAPHLDLARTDATGRRSTHTFLLYLSDCGNGGETVLLEDLNSSADEPPLAVVAPARGRLLLFPHDCPHKGNEVLEVPKLLLRGEMV